MTALDWLAINVVLAFALGALIRSLERRRTRTALSDILTIYGSPPRATASTVLCDFPGYELRVQSPEDQRTTLRFAQALAALAGARDVAEKSRREA